MTGLSDDARLAATLPGEDSVAGLDDEPQGFVRGAAVGRYMLISPAGTGAMGMVFAAYDPELDRKVALKILKPRGSDLSRSRERLQREAQALAKLDHPNVVAVHDVGVHDGQLFVAMEFIEGQTLGAWMESAPALSTGSHSGMGATHGVPVRIRPWREVLKVFMHAGRGLATAHEAGLVHRDFKPDNVMLSEDERVRVMDFGLARVDEVEVTGASDLSAPVGSLTQTGTMLGTPAYMSLEQFGTGQVDARSDQFGFCVALYEALYGERPFVGETVGELVFALQEGGVRGPLRGAHVPSWVRTVVLRGLAAEPEDRFESMWALLDALAADPIARRRRVVTRVGLGLALVAGLGGVLTLSGTVSQRDAVIEEQASELELKNIELKEQLATQAQLLSIQRGLRAKTLVGTGNEAEALLLGVQAVGVHAGAWAEAPRETVEGLEQVLAHDTVIAEASHVLEGHEDYLTYVAYSPDGARIATSSVDGTVRIWDPVHGRLLATLDSDGGHVYSLAFSPDGVRLATVHEDGRAWIWDTQSGESLTVLVGHTAKPTMLAFSPDGAQLATAGERNVRLWDVETGESLVTFTGDSKRAVSDLAYTPDGTRLVTGGADGNARVWDTKTGSHLATLAGHAGDITAISISPGGTRVATSSTDTSARTWSLETGELVATLEGHDLLVRELAYSPDGTRLTTVSWDRTGRIYDPETGELVAPLTGGHGYGLASLAYTPDGRSIATGAYDGSGALWDSETGELRARLRGHSADIWSLAFAPDGHQLATASVDHSARLWDIDTGVAVLEGPELDVRDFVYSPDHSRLATLSMDGRLRLWAGETGEPLLTLDEGDGARMGNVAYARDGRQLAVVSPGRLRIWDAQTGTLRSTMTVPAQETGFHLSYSPAGTQLWFSSERNIWVYDAQTHEHLATIAKDRTLSSHAYSPDDEHLAVVNSASTVQLWDPRTGSLTADFEIPGDHISQIRYSPDGTEIATASTTEGIRMWDAHSLTPRVSLPRSHGVKLVVYAPDGTQLAGASASEGVRIWDVETSEILIHLMPDTHELRTEFLTYSPDGSRIAILSGGSLRTHNTKTGELLAVIDGRRSIINRVEFWPNGDRLTSMNADNTLEIWDAVTGDSLVRERIGTVREDGSIAWPIAPRELTRIACVRLKLFERTYPKAQDICTPLVGD